VTGTSVSPSSQTADRREKTDGRPIERIGEQIRVGEVSDPAPKGAVGESFSEGCPLGDRQNKRPSDSRYQSLGRFSRPYALEEIGEELRPIRIIVVRLAVTA
jgi:hypothetical protein